MDPSSISELVHYRIEVGHGPDKVTRAFDPSNYLELREYVQTRDARERALAPGPTRKMEVGSFAEQHQHHHHHQHELQQDIGGARIGQRLDIAMTRIALCRRLAKAEREKAATM